MESAQKWSEEYLSKNEETSFNLLIGSGATYLKYLSTRNFDFIVNEDVDAVQCFHNRLFEKKSKTLMFTTLKVFGPLESSQTQNNEYNNLLTGKKLNHASTDERISNSTLLNCPGPDLTFLHIRAPPSGIEIRPFNMRGSAIFDCEK